MEFIIESHDLLHYFSQTLHVYTHIWRNLYIYTYSMYLHFLLCIKSTEIKYLYSSLRFDKIIPELQNK